MSQKKKDIRKLIVINIPDNIDLEIISKLLSNIHINYKGCWVRGKDSTIYTTIKYNGVKQQAHRVSYEIFKNRKIPFNMQGCHSCDVKACINPDHIFIGTQSDNMQDAKNKRRVYSIKIEKNKWADYPKLRMLLKGY